MGIMNKLRLSEKIKTLPKQQIIDEYNAGGSISSMRKKYAMKDENLKKALQEWGVTLRENPAAKALENVKQLTEDVLRKLYIDQKYSQDQIARMYRIGPDAVNRLVHKYNLQHGNKRFFDKAGTHRRA